MKPSTANTLGVLSLVGWSMNVALTRHLGEANAFGMPGISFALAGALLILFDLVRGKGLPWRSDADPRFWIFGGGAFVVYMLLYVGSLSWSDDRRMTVPLGLVNYTWPSIILLLMPLFFNRPVRWGVLLLGLAACMSGVSVSMLWGTSLGDTADTVVLHWPAFAMMAVAALLWGFYCNAARKWGGEANGTGVFFFASGAVLVVFWLVGGEPLGFTRQMLLPFILHALLVNAVCYLLWDIAVRRGNIGLMGTLANFLPITMAVFSSWYLGDPMTSGVWIGCLLVTAGALLCGKGLR